jgi:hypothetical protein
MKKMFHIFSHQGNANENYMRFHLTPVRMVSIKDKNKSVVVAQRCPLSYLGGRDQEAHHWRPAPGKFHKTPS